jgi:hypothetical protein
VYEAQTTGIEQRIFRGEFFAAKTENPEWDNEPCFQLYDSQEIVSPADLAGRKIIDGVEVNAATRALRYFVRNDSGGTSPIERARMIHWFKPHAVNQVRGISDMAQAVNPLVDIHELKRLTTRSAKASQTDHAGAERHGEDEGPRRDGIDQVRRAWRWAGSRHGYSAARAARGRGRCRHRVSQCRRGGTAPHAEISDAAGRRLHYDLLMRDVCAGWGVPAEFFWSIAKLGGANTRFVLSKADLLFQMLADGLIYRFCTPIAYRYLKHRIETGKLRAPKDPDWARKMSWQTPPRVTVDNGNEGALQIELLANGLITLRQYCNARGLNYRHEMRQWIREPIEFVKMAAVELKGADIPQDVKDKILERWSTNLPIWRAAKPGAVTAQPNETEAPQKPGATTEEEKEAA